MEHRVYKTTTTSLAAVLVMVQMHVDINEHSLSIMSPSSLYKGVHTMY